MRHRTGITLPPSARKSAQPFPRSLLRAQHVSHAWLALLRAEGSAHKPEGASEQINDVGDQLARSRASIARHEPAVGCPPPPPPLRLVPRAAAHAHLLRNGRCGANRAGCVWHNATTCCPTLYVLVRSAPAHVLRLSGPDKPSGCLSAGDREHDLSLGWYSKLSPDC